MAPKVSVCIPAFNHDRFIRRCIDSVLGQSMQDLEIVVTDDCSTDNTLSIIRSIQDPRVRLFSTDLNSGPSAAMAINLRHAKGKYVSFLASDDIFHADKLKLQSEILDERPATGIVFSRMRYVDERDQVTVQQPVYDPVDRPPRSRSDWLRTFFFEGNTLSAPTAMMRRRVLDEVGPFDNRLLQTQDFDMWIRVALRADIHVIEQPLIDYRIHDNDGNTSANTPERQARTHWELTKVLERFVSLDDPALFAEIFGDARDAALATLPCKVQLAELALRSDVKYVQAFGLDLAYRLLGDPEVQPVMSQAGLGYRWFFQKAADIDVFGMVRHAWAVGQVQNWQQAHRDAEAWIADLVRSLDAATEASSRIHADNEALRDRLAETAARIGHLESELRRAWTWPDRLRSRLLHSLRRGR